MTLTFPDPTFRDPAGSLVLEQDRAVRHIHPEAREAVQRFIDSPFYWRLVERGDMIGTAPEESSVGLRLLHPRVPIPTYPWEWTPSQWLAAAELTLSLCDEGLEEGWVLKDATPLNILFIGSRPVLVDVLSFERRDPAASLWLAYGQYVRTFLLPLLANRLLHWPLELSLFKRDGYEPAEVYAAMRWSQRLSPAALWPITIPTLLDRRKTVGSSVASAPGRDPALSLHILKRTLAGLRKRTRAALPRQTSSNWSGYTDTLTHYTSAQSAQKKVWVRSVLEELSPRNLLDVGANTGEYSVLAANCGAEVVALERDAEAAERIVRLSRAQELPIQTIHADLARPTPSVGWENRESSALLPRLEGRFDLVMLLAVVHHLLLIEQIPLPAIVALCHRLTRRYLVIEWVPATDPMYQSLMRGRDMLYGSLTEVDLLAACDGLFRTLQRQTLDNGRILFLFEK
ncbi:class I SAM-dependent methyltransferase [Granulicella arctica]|uniref:SAM-dependent methyltransferase n=1 Tax=Granulicella arctica TaxID=940613 RepID=A0A7Y9TG45_9BACT|nr:class I SAM-dependent methyltransferase [Granulicella arctica]NYF78340.1 SAM-dependent methyltransferase [Granulicella arctica]